jgi:hypothetical protein
MKNTLNCNNYHISKQTPSYSLREEIFFYDIFFLHNLTCNNIRLEKLYETNTTENIFILKKIFS